MAPVGRQVTRLLRLATASLVVCAALTSAVAEAQVRQASASTPSGHTVPLPPTTMPAAAPSLQVVEIKIEGNRKHTRDAVLSAMSTRVGHPFDQAAFEKDIRKLTSRSWFVHVVPKKEYVPNGVVITLSVVERPTLEYVRYFGNEKIGLRKLKKETGLKAGDSFDPYAVREAARKIESVYQSKGFNDVTVDIPEGTQVGDHGAVFLINEGKKLKFADINFVGNSREIAPDGRLKKVVESKEPILGIIKGEVDREKIAGDKERLIDYYRRLGFFKAEVGRHEEYNADEDRLTLTFYIYEGPRYNVGSVTFIGNEVYPAEAFSPHLKLNSGDPFDQEVMNKDIDLVKDLYGSNGYVFCDAAPDLRFHLEPGVVDIIYRVKEGQQYRIGDIHVTIKGDNPHTRHSTILNRLSMRPGDIADIRQFRSSERRIKASGLFNVDPSKGELPRIVFSPPEVAHEVANRKKRASGKPTGDPDSFRGQSPDPQPVATGARGFGPGAKRGPARPQPTARPVREPVGQQVRMQSPDPYGGFGGRAVNPISPGPQPYAVNQPPAQPAYAGAPTQQPNYGAATTPQPYGARATPQSYAAQATPPANATQAGQPQYSAPAARPSYVTPAQYAQPAQDPLANESMPSSGGYVPRDFGGGPADSPQVTPGGDFLGGPESAPANQPTLPVEVIASEAQTGRFQLGAGVNSNAGSDRFDRHRRAELRLAPLAHQLGRLPLGPRVPRCRPEVPHRGRARAPSSNATCSTLRNPICSTPRSASGCRATTSTATTATGPNSDSAAG